MSILRTAGVTAGIAAVTGLAIWAALGPRYMRTGGPGHAAFRHLKSLDVAVQIYYMKHAAYPFSPTGRYVDYDALIPILPEDDRCRVEVDGKAVVGDPWGTPHRVEKHKVLDYVLVGAGPDRQFGTPDDVTTGPWPAQPDGLNGRDQLLRGPRGVIENRAGETEASSVGAPLIRITFEHRRE